MKVAIITGTSSGIGKALAEVLLENDYKVTGVSRKKSINHPEYTHLTADLSKKDEWEKLDFSKIKEKNPLEVVLINNAAVAGPVKYLGYLSKEAIVHDLNLNLGAPLMFMNKFLESFPEPSIKKTIINISTGAAKSPVDGLSLYCSTKAGLDMATRVVASEAERKGNNCKVFAIAPGIVDTEMQKELRGSDEKHFSRKTEFVKYNEEGKLSDPIAVANKYLTVIKNPGKFRDTIFSISIIQ